MCKIRFFEVLSLAFLFFLGSNPVLASIGTVMEVRPGATVTSGGSTEPIVAGMQIDSGDLIVTDAKGIVQLIFLDETKMAVGPNARMIVDASMMRGGKRARNFAVKALGGSFRFISGKSDSNAYRIETPNATMGIRGTAFDFWVDGSSRTAVTMLEGRVSMCKSEGECTEVSGQCSLATADRGRAISQPTDKDQAAKIILAGFPFIMSQNLLVKELRAEGVGCDRTIVLADDPLLPLQQPPQPVEPPQSAPPVPASTGFPGQSGDEGPSEGKGNNVSDGQSGTGTGSGQGATNRNEGNGAANANENAKGLFGGGG